MAVWVTACGHQYAARHTLDYHDTVIVNLLLWSLALPLGRCFSVDAARATDSASPRSGARIVGGCGFVLSLAWLYLNTAMLKDGAAWWSEGNAVHLAVTELAAQSPTGMWAIEHLPAAFFTAATHAVMAIEWVVPFLLLSPWRHSALRSVSCVALVCMHAAMWLLMDIGSFPPTMIAAVVALLPASFWHRLGIAPAEDVAPQPPRPVPEKLLICFLAATVLINVEGTRLRSLGTETDWPYPGAEWVLRLKYVFGVESSWAMYAPEPARYGGWWVAAGRRRNGDVIDLITGETPVQTRPFPRRGAHAGLLGHYWSEPPYEGGPQHTYLRYLLWRNGRAPRGEQVTDLCLVFLYEPPPAEAADGSVSAAPWSPPRAYPLAVLGWPTATPTVAAATPESTRTRGILDSWTLYRAELDRLGDPAWRPRRLEPGESCP